MLEQDGSAGKDTCCQSWQPELIPGIHMVDEENSYKLSSAPPHASQSIQFTKAHKMKFLM